MKIQSSSLKSVIQLGLLGGILVIYLSLVGMVEVFDKRDIVANLLSMGQLLYLLPFLLMGYMACRKLPGHSLPASILAGALSGITGGLVATAFLFIGSAINLREIFINVSPGLFNILSFGLPLPAGAVLPPVAGAVIGLIGAAIFLLPKDHRKAVITAIIYLVLIGLLRDLIVTVIARWGVIGSIFNWMFAFSGLSLIGAIAILVVTGAISYWNNVRPKEVVTGPRTPRQVWTQRGGYALAGLFILLLPAILGVFFSEVLDTTGLFILMGLGLNIVVGFAGLLDLGYVAFYAIGAYTIGILTSPEMSWLPFHMTWWQALPFALLASLVAGVILGLPVLKVRGDYLAIVTLGFGEIVRLLFLSDWLRPYLGGTQGIQLIQHPMIGPIELDTQDELYYLILACILIAIFISSRLKTSRVGRSWMSVREDEDVAQAMGINLVATKLLAFATGAFFAGLGGTIFAAKLSSVYPHSMNFIVSINVLASIIIGGMGSVPGVVVGALAIVGLPELLREFAEFRLLVYGAVLVGMMLYKPEGLWPEERRKLELHEELEPELQEL